VKWAEINGGGRGIVGFDKREIGEGREELNANMEAGAHGRRLPLSFGDPGLLQVHGCLLTSRRVVKMERLSSVIHRGKLGAHTTS